MKAIQTRYVGPGPVKGSRILVSDGDRRMSLDYDDSLNSDQNHERAVSKFCQRSGWHGRLVGGGLRRAGVDSGKVWVFLESWGCKADGSKSLVFSGEVLTIP